MDVRKDHFVVIGARGFIGSWICRLLLEEGVKVTVTDTNPDPRSMSSVLSLDQIEKVNYLVSDARNSEEISEIISGDVTHVIYLAGLLRPASENNPLLSSQVSIGGLMNVFEAAVRRGRNIGIVYSSTAAVYGPAAAYHGGEITQASLPMPTDHYGLHRYAMELTADVYFRQHGLKSMGLRPWIVYGAGRFHGLSAQPSLAMFAAAAGAPFHMAFGGTAIYHHVRDVALAFIRGARAEMDGAIHANIPGESVQMEDLIQMIARYAPGSDGLISCELKGFNQATKLNDPTLERYIGPLPSPTEERVRKTIDEYRRLLREGLLTYP
jgi:nucleoside-diphosphate-sugar epimerase